MESLYTHCCGLDVHAKTVVACLLTPDQKQVRTFGTMSQDLLELADWLRAAGCTHVAIESTGVYWRPVYNLLEGRVHVILVNAHHVKAVPGRKTDVKDCQWLADLLQHGLLQASFIPPPPIRELRELTRHRESLVRDQAAVGNRIQKVLESGNIKLGQVVTDVLGVSGRQMIRALVAGEQDPQVLAAMAKSRLRSKMDTLRLALEGRLTEAQRFVLGELLDMYEQLEAAVLRASEKIETLLYHQEPTLGEAVTLLQSAPGVGHRVAQIVVSEIGIDMGRFPTDKQICNWAGICPGNHESAGKRRSGKTSNGNRYLRSALVQAAWTSRRVRDCSLSRLYQRLIRRMGKKKALVAVAHRLLIVLYHMLREGRPYEEREAPVMAERQRVKAGNRLVRRLESLGFRVTVETVEPMAVVPSTG